MMWLFSSCVTFFFFWTENSCNEAKLLFLRWISSPSSVVLPISFLTTSPNVELLSPLIPRKTWPKLTHIIKATVWSLGSHLYRGRSGLAGCWARCFAAESNPPVPPPHTDAPDFPRAAAGTFCTLNAREECRVSSIAHKRRSNTRPHCTHCSTQLFWHLCGNCRQMRVKWHSRTKLHNYWWNATLKCANCKTQVCMSVCKFAHFQVITCLFECSTFSLHQ